MTALYSDESVDRVRDAIDMADLVGAYQESGIGRDGKALCVFHDERTPSMSVDVDKKVFHCFGCDAEGDAIEFVRRAEGLDFRGALELLAARYRVELEQRGAEERRPAPASRPAPWPAKVLARIAELRGWTPDAIARLGLALDGDRIALPVQDDRGRVLGKLRYQPNPERRDPAGGRPKMLAAKGVPRALFPPPERVTGDPLWIVEGEPDAVTAQSIGLPAIGVPGTGGWSADWAARFTGRNVVICPDCDENGRDLARRIAADLRQHAREIRIVDLAPQRDDGYDLTDAALEHRDDYADLRRLLHDMARLADPIKPADQDAHLGGQRLREWQQTLRRRVRGEEVPEADPIPLPFAELNEATNGGIRPGQLIVVSGWTGHNKSNLADQILDSATEAGRSGMLYMTEMSLADRGDRYLARHSGVPFQRLRRGKLEGRDRARAEQAIARMRWPAMLISDWTAEQVCEDILRGGWGIAVIDHLHDFPYRREEDLRHVVQLFASTARTSTKNGPGTCVVLVCQLNDGQMSGSRDVERPRPGMHSLKGTSAIKQAADEIIFVWMRDDEVGRATTDGEVWNVKGRMNGTAALGVELNVGRMKLVPATSSDSPPAATGGYMRDPEGEW